MDHFKKKIVMKFLDISESTSAPKTTFSELGYKCTLGFTAKQFLNTTNITFIDAELISIILNILRKMKARLQIERNHSYFNR